MGFGTLFVGYLIGMNFAYQGFTDIISYCFIFYALLLLFRHNSYFKKSFYAIIPLCVSGLLYFVFELINFLGIRHGLDTTLINSYYSILSAILKLVYTAFLLKGIEVLSNELDIQTIRVKAFRNRLFTYLYYALLVFVELSHDGRLASFARYAFLPVMLFGFVVLILNAALFYSSYMWICLEGDEDMERKESSIGFIRNMQKKTDSFEEKLVEKKKEEKMRKADKKSSKKGKKK
ncbi:MAG: hypothetical protein IIW20_02585 [Clostridia bacterium]|nr:hypothetical protein [Clostridia bacterium]